MTMALLIFLVCAVAFLLGLTIGRGRTRVGQRTMEQQLGEFRMRIDTLVESQRSVPLELASAQANQLRTLGDVRERLGQLVETTKRLESVGESVAEVQELLKVPKLRGTLGEVWLEDLLRQVFPSSHYQMQFRFRSGEAVDAVLNVGDRMVPIDAKFPLESFQRMQVADAVSLERERRTFRRSLKQRIDEIADKYIRPDEATFDFALMYIPAEGVYYEAIIRGETLEDDESVVGYAISRRVIPVSPNTFYAYLSAILHGLKALHVEERAVEIRDSLAGLQLQFGRFQKAYELVGTHLERAAKQYSDSEKQLDKINLRFENITGVESVTNEEPKVLIA